MEIKILGEYGYDWALRGIALSYKLNKTRYELYQIADKLAHKDGGHNKFLESIQVYIEINAPLYWWKQFDTYRIGVTKQSESTMHTIMKRRLSQHDFEDPIFKQTLSDLNSAIDYKQFVTVVNNLPDGFLQRRIVCTNYKVLRHIISQRQTHKLYQWGIFCDYMKKNLKQKEWVI